MLRLELAQLAHERVELGVGDLGLVEDEVALVVVLDELAQLRDAFDDCFGGRALRQRAIGHARNLRADGELRRGRVIVHAVADLAGEQHRALGLAHTVSGETARGRDERLAAELHGIAAAPGQLAPRVEQRLPQRLRLLADRPVRRDRAPRDPTAAVEEPRERGGVVEIERADVEVDDLRARRRARGAGRRGRTRARPRRRCTRRARSTAGRSRPRDRSDLRRRASSTSAGSSKKHTSARVGKARRDTSSAIAAAHARGDTRARAGTRASASMPASTNATPSVSGPATCTLTLLRRAGLACGDLEEREQAGVRAVVEQRSADGRADRRADVELDRAVVVHDDTGDRARPLRDDTFARANAAGAAASAGSSGRQRSVSAAAACASRCGRLPIAVAVPALIAPPSSGSPMKIRRIGRRRHTRRSGVHVDLAVVHPRDLGPPPGHDRHRARRRDRRVGRPRPARVAAVLLWVVWAAGLFALFAPRPWGLTLLRIVAPVRIRVRRCSSVTSTSAASAALALVGSGSRRSPRAVGADRVRDRERARVRRRATLRPAHPDAAAARTDPARGRCSSALGVGDRSVAPRRRALRASARSRRSSASRSPRSSSRVAAPAVVPLARARSRRASRSPIR